eukprot:SAG25_NODE_885_length_4932_cov_8.691082_4_plen_194_part_00
MGKSMETTIINNGAWNLFIYDFHLRNVLHCVIVLARSCCSLSEAIVAPSLFQRTPRPRQSGGVVSKWAVKACRMSECLTERLLFHDRTMHSVVDPSCATMFCFQAAANRQTVSTWGGRIWNFLCSNATGNNQRHPHADGVFNSWNRQVFIWEHLPGQLPNLTPKPFLIEHNFLISNCAHHSHWPPPCGAACCC